MKTVQPIRSALLSVSDKTNIVDLARALVARGVTLISTGGTAKMLRDHNINSIEIAEYTGFPEIMDGRVKTLHPNVFAGLLARGEDDTELLQSHNIKHIDLLVVNLYPFEQIIQDPDCDLTRAIEYIDVGGPSMLRAAAKNFAHVSVLCSPADYTAFLQELTDNDGAISKATRFKFAQKVFQHTQRYDTAISNYLKQHCNDEKEAPAEQVTELPKQLDWHYHKQQDLRYGENPHQQAAFYVDEHALASSLAKSQQLQGKPCSFNNLVDADTALMCVRAMGEKPACVIVKHANPCGIAIADSPKNAYLRAYATDPVSAFGGILAFNNEIDEATAIAITEQQFAEVIIAPAVSASARTVFSCKPNLRVLCCENNNNVQEAGYDYKSISGGLLIQQRDNQVIDKQSLHIVSKKQPTPQQLDDLLFAWHSAKFVKSNAIVYAKDLATVGIGAGQMSRVFSAHIASLKAQDAQLDLTDSVMGSDAFLPFKDSVSIAAEHGISAIIQPGGSIRDAEVTEAADAAGLIMVFTGVRHFRH